MVAPKQIRIAALALAASLLVAGCGGGDDELASTSPKSAATATPSASPAATPTTDDAAPSSEDATVAIQGFTYDPGQIMVPAGGKVTWSNRDKSNHTVTFEDAEQRGIANLREGQSRSVTFRKPGTFAYVCEFHPGMAGTVEVQ